MKAISPRLQLAAGVVGTVSGIAGLGTAGWFGNPWEPSTTVIVVTLSALAAGCIEGSGTWKRLYASGPYLVGGITLAAAAAWYLAERSSFRKIELLVPLLIAAIAFTAWYWLFKKLGSRAADSGNSRQAGALLAAIAFSIAMASYLPVPRDSATVKLQALLRRSLTVDVTPQGRVQFDGEFLDEAQLSELFERSARTDRATEVIVRIPKDTAPRDPAVVSVVAIAMRTGLNTSVINSNRGLGSE